MIIQMHKASSVYIYLYQTACLEDEETIRHMIIQLEVIKSRIEIFCYCANAALTASPQTPYSTVIRKHRGTDEQNAK